MRHSKVLLFSLLFLLGCGPPVPLRKPMDAVPVVASGPATEIPPELPEISPAHALGLQVLPPAKDGAGERGFKKPVASDHACALQKRTSRNQIAFVQPLDLSDADLFFAWSESFLSTRIVEVTVGYELFDGGNRWAGRRTMGRPTYDAFGGRWYFSLSKVFEEIHLTQENFNEANTHVLNLDLLLADQTRQQIEIRFRLRRIR